MKISFADTAVRVPPFTDILSVGPDWHIHLTLNLGNFRYLFTDEVYGLSYVYSLKTAFFSTLICLLLGYPMAYAIARTSKSTQSLLLLVIILPFWTSFLLRVYALEGIIRETGLLNSALLWLGVIHRPLQIMRTTFAVYLGIIYTYLPFMVLPLFATLEKLDHSLLEAAADLGSPPWRTFIDVTLPLSMPGIIAGSMLVFIPAIGEFVIPTLLGGPDNLMIGTGAVGRILRQSRLAGRLRGRHRFSGLPGRADRALSALQCEAARGVGDAGAHLTAAHLHTLHRHRHPLRADSGVDRVLVQRLGAGERVGRILHHLVPAAAAQSTRFSMRRGCRCKSASWFRAER